MTYTKKDLEAIYQISDNTVYKTLQACLLDTSQESYSEEERERFEKARSMLSGKGRNRMTYEKVTEYFQQKEAKTSLPHSGEEGSDGAEEAENVPESLQAYRDLEVELTNQHLRIVQEIADRAAKRVVSIMPQIGMKSLMKLLDQGHIQKGLKSSHESLAQFPMPDPEQDYIEFHDDGHVYQCSEVKPLQLRGTRTNGDETHLEVNETEPTTIEVAPPEAGDEGERDKAN